MKHFLKIPYIAVAILFISWNSFGQQDSDYTTKIDRLIQATNPRSFNGVVFIQQNGKTKYAKVYGYSDFF